MTNQKKKAFTLAEVLITLAVVGIVAAVVMPTVITKVQDHVFANKFLSVYAKLNNAVLKWQADNDCIDDVRVCLDKFASGTTMISLRMAPQEIFRDIVAQEFNEKFPKQIYGDSVFTIKYRDILGNEFNLSNPNYTNTCTGVLYCAVLKDGTTIQAHHVRSMHNHRANYVLIGVDLNGPSKPNQYGRDRFLISTGVFTDLWNIINTPVVGLNPYNMQTVLTVKPFGETKECLYAYKNINKCEPDNGCSPAAYILKHRKLPSKELIKTNCSGS